MIDISGNLMYHIVFITHIQDMFVVHFLLHAAKGHATCSHTQVDDTWCTNG